MNKVFHNLLSLILFFTIALPASAGFGETIDLGEMVLDQKYEVKGDFSNYKGYFVASKDGTLVVNSSSSGTIMVPYADATFETPIEHEVAMLSNGVSYDMEVKAGTTYYFYIDFCMNDAVITLSMGEKSQLELIECHPAPGSTFLLSGAGMITLSFNKYIDVGNAEIQAGEVIQPLVVNAHGSNISIEAKETIIELLSKGELKVNDTFTLRIHHVRTMDGQQQYGENGLLEITYICGAIPAQLISTQHLGDSTFLSYWPEGDPAGTIVLTFDKELQPTTDREQECIAIITYGDLDTGEYYQEVTPYSVNGNQLTADFTGKFRRPKDMVSTGRVFDNINVKISGIRDLNGEYTYTVGSSSTGSYNFNYPYVEVKADIISDFFPVSGASLNGVEEVEVWVTDYLKLKHEGLVFITEKDSIAAEKCNVVADSEYPGAYILTVTVPEKVKNYRGDVKLTFKNLQCADGLDHSADLTAYYTLSEPDGIQAVTTHQKISSVFNLKGQRIQKPSLPAGIYIMNGKKVILQ